jgi:uncharacterized membrane protein (Fun14 family)
MRTEHSGKEAAVAYTVKWRALRSRERVVIWALAATIACFGVAVVAHTVFTSRHRTDLGVFLTAGAAIRDQRDIYQVSWHDDHYLYPPLLAILLSPLTATLPARGEPATIGFALTVAIAYVISIACLLVAIHLLARFLEERALPSLEPAATSRRWWVLRATPIAVMLHSLGRDLQLGQLEEVLLLFLCCSVVSTLRGRSFRGGLWLSAAICLKIFPAFLLIWALVRRDMRFITGAIVGCVIGLVLIPMATLGPQRAIDLNREYASTFLLPAATRGAVAFNNSTLSMKDIHNFSLLGVFHSAQFLGSVAVPPVPSPPTRLAAAICGVVVLLMTLVPFFSKQREQFVDATILFGQLIAVSLLVAPVFQSYHLPLLIPLILGLASAGMQHSGGVYPDRRVLLVFAFFMVANTAASVKGLEPLRDAGLPTLTALALWAQGILELHRQPLASVAVRGRTSARSSRVSDRSAQTAGFAP